jgi:fermentation-respiration switch protein FrsA (DUF1100 family)
MLAAALATLFFRQRSFVFVPSQNIMARPSDIGVAYDDVILRCASGARLHCWLLPGARSGKLFILLPGSIGNISHELATAGFLLDFGASLLMVDYPGYGRSAGRPNESGWYEAAEAAWNFATTEAGFEKKDILLFGRSLGCAPALDLARRHQCGGVVFHSGFTSVADLAARRFWLLPARWFCYVRMNTLGRIENCRSPILFLHPESDEVVSRDNIRRVYDRARCPKLFVSVRGGHYSSQWQSTPGIGEHFRTLMKGDTLRWN